MAPDRSASRAGPGDLERAILEVLWTDEDALTVRTVHERLAEHRELAYTTVMTVLDRMAKKGTVLQEREGRAYLYRPAASREEMTASLMNDALEEFGDAARRSALLAFVNRASAADRTALSAALADLEQPGDD